MAVDLALLQTAIAGGPPVLRFYSWRPPALSLGYNQNAAIVDKAACTAAGVDVVRRPTGGRAVLHADEVTYTIVLPPDHPLAKLGITESYKELSRGLLAGFHRLGLRCELAQPVRPVPAPGGRLANGEGGASAACFDAPSWYELIIAGRKVVGSAQVRRRGALLQHGSVPLTLRGEDLYRLLHFGSEEARQTAVRLFTAKAAGLCEQAGRLIRPAEVTAALAAGFAAALAVQCAPGALDEKEQLWAVELQKEALI